MTLDKIIEKQVKRFDKRFPDGVAKWVPMRISNDEFDDCTKETKIFLRQAIRQAVEKALKEVELNNKDIFWGNVGFSKAIFQQLTNHKKLLSKKEKK